ncbi:MAG: WXG100 family type VII secretion target [bacterium]|nr:WXG100 family type VII secretion target [bacterium]
MAMIQVTASELRKQAEVLRGLNTKFQTQVTNLETVEQSLKGMWEGQANTAFHSAFVKDKGQMDNFHSAIEQYIAALLVIAQKYEQTEMKNTDTATTRVY